MYKVPQDTMIATVTDLRRRTAEVMKRAEEGSAVVVQKDNTPRGVYLSFPSYERMIKLLERLDDLEVADIAVKRKAAIERGEMGTISLDDMIAEFSPELLSSDASVRDDG